MQGPAAPRLVVVETNEIDLVEDSAQHVGDCVRRRMFDNGGYCHADLAACPFTPITLGESFTGHTRVIRTTDGHWVEVTAGWRASTHLEVIVSLRLPKADAPFRILYHQYARNVDGWVDLPVDGVGVAA